MGQILAGASYRAKIDFPKTCVPEDISQRCPGANAVHKKRAPRVAAGRWGIFFNLIYAALVNRIIPHNEEKLQNKEINTI